MNQAPIKTVTTYAESQGLHLLVLVVENPGLLSRWFGKTSEIPVKAPVRLRCASSDSVVLEVVRTDLGELFDALRDLEVDGWRVKLGVRERMDIAEAKASEP